MEKLYKSQIILYEPVIWSIGGIETFLYYFSMNFKDEYDIAVLYRDIHIGQYIRLVRNVKMFKYDELARYECDIAIVNGIMDSLPFNVHRSKVVRMVHSCKLRDTWCPPRDYDVIVPVSDIAKESFMDDISLERCNVINNITYKAREPRKVLRLISATRLTAEKGEKRMMQLADVLNEANIPFIWTVFTKTYSGNVPRGMVFHPPTLNINDYIADSDYLVQLSDSESFCYSIVEALELGVGVITTPLPILSEIGFEEGVNGFTIFHDNKVSTEDVMKIYNTKLDFKYKSKNDKIKKQWREILGKGQKSDYSFDDEKVNVMCLKDFYDIDGKKKRENGDVFQVNLERAVYLLDKGLVLISEV